MNKEKRKEFRNEIEKMFDYFVEIGILEEAEENGESIFRIKDPDIMSFNQDELKEYLNQKRTDAIFKECQEAYDKRIEELKKDPNVNFQERLKNKKRKG